MNLRLLAPGTEGELESVKLDLDTTELFRIVTATQRWPDFLIVDGKQVFSIEDWHSGGADYVLTSGFFVQSKGTSL